MGSEWLRGYAPVGGRPETDDDRPLLICFPHAGGAAGAFLPLARLLAPVCEVLAVQYPGRQDRRHEEPVADIGGLADALAHEVARHVTGPYCFFGHSMGAVIAYETARRLGERRTTGPARLFLSGRGAPTPVPSRHDRLSTEAEILAAVTRLGGTDPQFLEDPEIRAMIMPALSADYRALASYAWVPGPKLRIPLTVLVGDKDPVVTVAEAAAWEHFTTEATEHQIFSGGHFYLVERLHEVAKTITAGLKDSVGAGVPGFSPP